MEEYVPEKTVLPDGTEIVTMVPAGKKKKTDKKEEEVAEEQDA